MARVVKMLGILLALLAMLSHEDTISAHAKTYLEIESGTLWVQGYRIELAETAAKPVILRRVGEETIASVESRQGPVELILSDNNIVFSQAAHQFITDYRSIPEPPPTQAATAAPTRPSSNACPHCGEPNPQEHTCPRCRAAYCIHDDLQCSYRLNPVPTPFTYTDSLGNETTQGISADGRLMINHPYNPSGDKYKAPEGWAPGKAYEKANATPSPDPEQPGEVDLLGGAE